MEDLLVLFIVGIECAMRGWMITDCPCAWDVAFVLVRRVDVRPFVVLSPKAFNDRTSLVIGLPMTSADYNADNPFAVVAGKINGRKTGQTSYILCHQPKSFDWRLRGGAPHPMKKLAAARFAEVLAVLNQIIELA